MSYYGKGVDDNIVFLTPVNAMGKKCYIVKNHMVIPILDNQVNKI